MLQFFQMNASGQWLSFENVTYNVTKWCGFIVVIIIHNVPLLNIGCAFVIFAGTTLIWEEGGAPKCWSWGLKKLLVYSSTKRANLKWIYVLLQKEMTANHEDCLKISKWLQEDLVKNETLLRLFMVYSINYYVWLNNWVKDTFSLLFITLNVLHSFLLIQNRYIAFASEHLTKNKNGLFCLFGLFFTFFFHLKHWW